MIDISRLFTRTTRFKAGETLDQKQADASARVSQILDKVDFIGHEMAQLDQTQFDRASKPKVVSGGVEVPGRFGLREKVYGHCRLDETGSGYIYGRRATFGPSDSRGVRRKDRNPLSGQHHHKRTASFHQLGNDKFR